MPASIASTSATDTREALLEAGLQVAGEHGLAGLSVNQVVAAAGVAKGTFYVHFADRSAFVDALHERFHQRVADAAAEAVEGVPPGAEQIARAAVAYLDVCLAFPAVKALALEARSDPALASPMAGRHDRAAQTMVPSFKAMGWPDTTAAAQLFSAMTAEIALREFEAGRKVPAARRTLRRFLGLESR
jgi:TetR/AcrR family transcriptional regulator, transcriptional repressor for nem operon